MKTVHLFAAAALVGVPLALAAAQPAGRKSAPAEAGLSVDAL